MLRQRLAGQLPNSLSMPDALARLCDFADVHGNPVACDFRLTDQGQEDVFWWSKRNPNIYEHFFIFGNDGLHSLYGYWTIKSAALEGAPIVYLDGEGVGNRVMATSTEEFLALLAAGRIAIGRIESWEEGSPDCENIAAFREWLASELGIQAPNDPMSIVLRAARQYPELDEWLEAQRRKQE